MKFGKYLFESFKEFQEIKNEAIKVGAITAEQFFNFLGYDYSHKLIENLLIIYKFCKALI